MHPSAWKHTRTQIRQHIWNKSFETLDMKQWKTVISERQLTNKLGESWDCLSLLRVRVSRLQHGECEWQSLHGGNKPGSSGRPMHQNSSGKRPGRELQSKRTQETCRRFPWSLQLSTDRYTHMRKLTEAMKEPSTNTRGGNIPNSQGARNSACSH